MKIKQELYQKGIVGETYNQGAYRFEDDNLKDMETEEQRIAYEEARKSMAKADLIDEKSINKMARRLSSLGHRTDIIYRIIEEYKREIVNEEYI